MILCLIYSQWLSMLQLLHHFDSFCLTLLDGSKPQTWELLKHLEGRRTTFTSRMSWFVWRPLKKAAEQTPNLKQKGFVGSNISHLKNMFCFYFCLYIISFCKPIRYRSTLMRPAEKNRAMTAGSPGRRHAGRAMARRKCSPARGIEVPVGGTVESLWVRAKKKKTCSSLTIWEAKSMNIAIL